MGKPGKSRVKFKRPSAVPSLATAPAVASSALAAAASSSSHAAAGQRRRGGADGGTRRTPSSTTDRDQEEVDDEQGAASGINFVPCACWVPRGMPKAIPDKVQLTKEEMKSVIESTRNQLRDLEEEEKSDTEEGGAAETHDGVGDGEEDIEAKYGFDDYDDENDYSLGLGEAAAFADDDEDSLLEDPRRGDSDSEDEDFEIKPTDNLIITGHWEDESSILEVYVYNSEEGHLFVHHDMVLPACPLALEWINCQQADGKANFLAVGSMDPVIQVWDLDMIDCLEPACVLGERMSKKERRKLGAEAFKRGHVDAVLDLSWNRVNKEVLASGSVDQTVILWDFQNVKPSKVLKGFEAKVQSVLWHPTNADGLLTGCEDGFVRLFDVRQESKPQTKWKCGSSVEKVVWDPTSSNHFFVGTEKGSVVYYDARQKQKIWSVEAVLEPFSDLAVSATCPGLMLTASEDGEVQIWDTKNASPESGPSLVARRDMGVGKIMFVRFCPDEPFVICAGGDYGPCTFSVWDLRNTPGVVERFGSRVSSSSASGAEPMEEDH